jgi:hypothetical protein
MSKINIRFKQKKIYAKRAPKKYNVEKFITNPSCVEAFQIKIGGQFEPLLALDDDEVGIDELYKQFKRITNVVTKEVVGYRKRKLVEGMPPEIEKLCAQRRDARLKTINRPKDQNLRCQYKVINKQVRRAVKEQKS